jgi:lipopolysaccharide export LptBFGC system permease protein LptF
VSALKRLAIPLVVLATAIIYWFLSYEWAGSVLLLIFAIALGVMIWVLGPTLDDVGPTAPVDPEWHERQG